MNKRAHTSKYICNINDVTNNYITRLKYYYISYHSHRLKSHILLWEWLVLHPLFIAHVLH